MYFLSLLGEVELAAAIGYAGTLVFFNISVAIGVSIASTALVARAIGAGQRARARRTAGASLFYVILATGIIAVIMTLAIDPLLTLLGAKGRAHVLAGQYLLIVVPSLPLLGLAMWAGGLLRPVGDARRSMYITLAGAAVNAVLDPIFIFGIDMGVQGTALASLFARASMLAVGFFAVFCIHHLFAMPSRQACLRDWRALTFIAVPAVLTNIATPVGDAYVTWSIAPFGDSFVAGWAIIGRIMPVAFGGIFSLSAAVGPILAQNFGARCFDRVQRGYTDAMVFVLVYTIVAWAILFLARDAIAAMRPPWSRSLQRSSREASSSTGRCSLPMPPSTISATRCSRPFSTGARRRWARCRSWRLERGTGARRACSSDRASGSPFSTGKSLIGSS